MMAACAAGGESQSPGTSQAPADTHNPAPSTGQMPAAGAPNASPPTAGAPAPMAITLVDHASFRRFSTDPERTAVDLRRVQRNMDAARARGIGEYLIFSRDTERLLTYDYAVPGVPGGALGPRAFPPGSSWRSRAPLFRTQLAETIAAADARGLRLGLHSNQMEVPPAVLELLQGSAAEGEALCVDRELTWQVYRLKVGELLGAVPGLDSLQITADETAQAALDCDEAAPDRQPAARLKARLDRLLNETVIVARDYGVSVSGRTWGRVHALEATFDPATMFDGLEPDLLLSLKDSEDDFYAHSPPSALIGRGDPTRQILEVDAWREHDGWNIFPCYMGDAWAERLPAARRAGLRQLAIRIAWDSDVRPLFDIPWGNIVNLEVARAMATGEPREADVLLREWIAATWPEAAREPAFALYKASPAFMASLHSEQGRPATDHSRVFRLRPGELPFDRIDSGLEWIQEVGGLGSASDFEARRTRIDAAYADIRGLIAGLGPAAPDDWQADLDRGARAQWRVARAVTDQLELRFYTKAGGPAAPAGYLDALATRARAEADDWALEDPEYFELLGGHQVVATLEGLGY